MVKNGTLRCERCGALPTEELAAFKCICPNRMKTRFLRQASTRGKAYRYWDIDEQTTLSCRSGPPRSYKWCVQHQHPVAGYIWRYMPRDKAREVVVRMFPSMFKGRAGQNYY